MRECGFSLTCILSILYGWIIQISENLLKMLASIMRFRNSIYLTNMSLIIFYLSADYSEPSGQLENPKFFWQCMMKPTMVTFWDNLYAAATPTKGPDWQKPASEDLVVWWVDYERDLMQQSFLALGFKRDVLLRINGNGAMSVPLTKGP